MTKKALAAQEPTAELCETQGLAAYKYRTDRVTAMPYYRMTVHLQSVL
jgi:TfoX/Sxy family transcriptional regulator of competence genes